MALTLEEQLDALRRALADGRDVLGPDLTSAGEQVLARAGDRLRLPDHTVVALAGPTGSGKSSLLNALAGAEVAEVAVTRPTTSEALAVVRGGGAEPLLDWLQVRRRHHLPDAGVGLVLLDLPDHDSVVTGHRLEAERLVRLVDAMVWVVDPQKYADAAVHEGYLRGLTEHRDVLLVVLNQVDRLTSDERAACHRDLAHLLADDGLAGVRVLDVSARTGEGVGTLRDALTDAARRRVAARARLAADVAAVAGRVLAVCGPPVRPDRAPRGALVDALAVAAGVPVVADAVRAERELSARRATGWPVTRWVARLRPDPLRRLHLGRGDTGRTYTGRTYTGRTHTGRTSVPSPGPAQLAAARGALRTYVDAATAGAPDAWVLAARHSVEAPDAELAAALDVAVAGTELVPMRDPRWWRVVGVLQWLLLGVAVVGGLWLGVLAGAGYLRVPTPDPPRWGEVPWPTIALVGGVGLGVLLAAVGRWWAAVGARRQAARATARLRDAVGQVAQRRVVDPADGVLAALVRTREAAQEAAGGRRPRRSDA